MKILKSNENWMNFDFDKTQRKLSEFSDFSLPAKSNKHFKFTKEFFGNEDSAQKSLSLP